MLSAPCKGRWSPVLLLLGVLLGAAVVRVERVAGQKVYRWTDERGVVHFADSPPSRPGFETYDLPTPPPAATPAARDEAEPAKDESRAAPARVVIEEQSSKSGGGDTQSYTGTVRNTGGKTATNVVVVVTVTETVQGAQCLEERIQVSPSTLPPDVTGTFSAEFQNPCFFGPTDAKLRPEWQ